MPQWPTDRFATRGLRLVAGLGLLAASAGAPSLASAATLNQQSPNAVTPTGCAIQLTVDSPAPDSQLNAGNYQISGLARDLNAAQGTGISQVQAFLGDRDQGGQQLGSAVPVSVPGGINGAYSMTIALPANLTGGEWLFVYGTSALSGQQSIVSLPFLLGSNNSSGNLPPPVANITCPALASATTSAPSPAASPTAAPAVSTPVPSTSTTTAANPAATAASIQLSVANPSSGQVVPQGPYQVSGQAYDNASMNGPGVDTVSFYLDDRDQGGTPLGTAMVSQSQNGSAPKGAFSVVLQFPNGQSGGHTLFVYAHSTVSNKEAIVQIPLSANNTGT